MRLHDLRHTVVSQFTESGASLRDIQVWLGHTSPVTSTRYTHVELPRLRAVAGQMDDAICAQPWGNPGRHKRE